MEWLEKKMRSIEKALKEVETSNLTNETKIVVLRCLKEELNLLNTQKESIMNNLNHLDGLKK